MTSTDLAGVKSVWESSIPWTFRDVPKRPSYSERRRMRYELQDYMDWFQDFPEKRILEVGSGSGLDAAEFARHRAIVTAVDVTDKGVEETQTTLMEASPRFGKYTVKKIMDAAHLPFRSDEFDLVYCFGVLHHLMYPRYAIREFARVAPSFLGMVYNMDSLLYAYSIKHLGLPFERFGTPQGTRAFTKGEVKGLFREFYSKVEVEPKYQVIDTPEKRKVKLNIPDELGLGWHLVIRARR